MIKLDDIQLPDLLWEDEFTWSKVAQQAVYSAAGSLCVQESVKMSGRAITLSNSSQNACYVPRQTVKALYGKKSNANIKMKLVFSDGREYDVRFRHSEGALELTPINPTSHIGETDFYILNTIRLMEVDE
jgi:hypothetical protein